MSLQFVIGNSGVGKTSYLYDWVIEASSAHPERTYIYVVPDQFTMQTQRELVCRHPNGGILNIEVQSFTRLAYRIFDEVGVKLQPILNDTGKMMVLRKVYETIKKDLRVLRISPKNPGALDEVKSLLSELVLYDVDFQQMLEAVEGVARVSGLEVKIKDIRRIYEAFFAYLKEHYITAEQVMDLLARVAGESALLKRSVLVFDGFTGFTPLQMKVMGEILQHSPHVLVSLTADSEVFGTLTDPQGLFYLTQKTIDGLQKIAHQRMVEIQDPILFSNQENQRLGKNPPLLHLENQLFRRQSKVYLKPQEQVKIKVAHTREQEVRFVASEIAKLVKTDGCKYGQIAVITNAMEQYETLLTRVLEEYGIPCFYDNKPPLLMNPMLEWIRSLLQMVAENFSYESVFRYLRCGLAEWTFHEIDQFENYVLEFGIQGMAGYEQLWIFKGSRSEKEITRLNQLRSHFIEELKPVVEIWKSTTATVRKKTVVLYEFMERKGLYEQLKARESYYLELDQPVKAKEYGQVYKIVLDLLDQYVELLGEETITATEYSRILDSGFADAAIGILPPGRDYVILGDVERTRLNEIEVLFFLGVNDGIVPRAADQGGILSESERIYLEDQGISLASGPREAQVIEKFYLYLLLTKPKQRLYVSYCQSDENGESMRPSMYLGQLKRLFFELEEEPLEELSFSTIHTEDELYQFLLSGMEQETLELSQWMEWKAAYELAKETETGEARLSRMQKAMNFRNQEHHISKELTRQLYGDRLYGSASRLEQFTKCPYSHFLKYGLQLRPRLVQSFTANDSGTVYHKALELFVNYLQEEQESLAELSDQRRKEVLEEMLEKGILSSGAEHLYRTFRGKYHCKRMLRILDRTAWVIQKQMEAGDFVIAKQEMEFHGYDSDMQIALSNGTQLMLHGRIDRLDQYAVGNTSYVRIIDYKSGKQPFGLDRWQGGLQLQLMMYLRAALVLQKAEHPERTIVPAGLFLQHIADPILKMDSAGFADSEQKQWFEQKIMEQLMLDGYVNQEHELISHMDHHAAMENSVIIPVRYNKNHTLSKVGTKVLNTRDFYLMLLKNEEMLTETGRKMMDGTTEIKPYRMGSFQQCTYCSYQGICGFDAKLPCYEYRVVETQSDSEILKKLEEQYGDQLDQRTKTSH